MKSDSTRGRPKTVGRPDAAGGRDVFAALEQLVGPLERSLPGSAEVVLHDLAALPDSIIAIEGDITGRRPGDPATDRLLEAAAGGDLRTRIGYRTTSPTGRSLLSTTIIIRDAEDRPVAALCINRDVTDWTIIGDAARSILGCEELLAPEDGARGVADDRPVRHIAVDAEGGDGPVLGIADDDRRRQEAAAGRGGRAITDASPEVAAGGRLEETVRGRVAGTAPGDVALDGDDRVGEGREIVEDDLRGSGQRSLKGADELLERGEDIPPAGSIRPPDGFGTTACGIALHWAFHAPYLASWLPWEAFTVLLLGSTI
jgi:hypothetical protein